MAEEMMAPEQQAQQETAPEATANPEEEVIAQVIQLIAGLSAESQRQLMGFLNQEFAGVMDEEQAEVAASPEEQNRKADVMSEAF